ncbi:hypothetical protein R1flu_015363 [Riccia fluitans]|uniref:Uncharacterized protein n=1 Tax=Riccia fluitans TaxID=41844 RepID=A0ABD1YIV2_9MARC
MQERSLAERSDIKKSQYRSSSGLELVEIVTFSDRSTLSEGLNLLEAINSLDAPVKKSDHFVRERESFMLIIAHMPTLPLSSSQ